MSKIRNLTAVLATAAVIAVPFGFAAPANAAVTSGDVTVSATSTHEVLLSRKPASLTQQGIAWKAEPVGKAWARDGGLLFVQRTGNTWTSTDGKVTYRLAGNTWTRNGFTIEQAGVKWHVSPTGVKFGVIEASILSA